jgi:hypothetical protein
MKATGMAGAGEPRLSPDFAARVMRQVDVARTRRRRRVTVAVVLCGLTLATIAGWRASHPGEPPSAAAEPPTVVTITWNVDASEQADVMNCLFPDAAPLARLVSSYSAASDGVVVADAADGAL